MAYPITIVDGRPQLDSLPVGKIVNYPLEKRDYRPFAQFRLCVNEEGLHLYLWAFELEVSPKSVQRVCLNLCPDQRKHLDLALFGNGSARLSIWEGDRVLEEQPVEVHADGEGAVWPPPLFVVYTPKIQKSHLGSGLSTNHCSTPSKNARRVGSFSKQASRTAFHCSTVTRWGP